MSDDREPSQTALALAYAKMGGAISGQMLHAAVRAYLNSEGAADPREPHDWLLANVSGQTQGFVERRRALGALLDAVIAVPEEADSVILLNTRLRQAWTARYDSDGSTASVDKYLVDCVKGDPK